MKSFFNGIFALLLASNIILDPTWSLALNNPLSPKGARGLIFSVQALSLHPISNPPLNQLPVNPSAVVSKIASELEGIVDRPNVKSSIPERIVQWWVRLPPESKLRWWSILDLVRAIGVSQPSVDKHLPAANKWIQNMGGPIIATDVVSAIVQYGLLVPEAVQGGITLQEIARALGISKGTLIETLPMANQQLQQLQRPLIRPMTGKRRSGKKPKRILNSPAVVSSRFQYTPEALAAAGIDAPELVELLTGQKEVTPEAWEIFLDTLLERQRETRVERTGLSSQEEALFFLTLDIATHHFSQFDICRAATLPINTAALVVYRESVSTIQRDALLEGIRRLRRGAWSAPQASRTGRPTEEQLLRQGTRLLEKSPTLQSAPIFDTKDQAIDWIRDHQELIKKELQEGPGGSFVHLIRGLAAAKKASLGWMPEAGSAHHALEKEELISQKLADTWTRLTQEMNPEHLQAVLLKPANILRYVFDRSFLTDLRRPTKPVHSVTASHILQWAMHMYGNALVKRWADSWRASHPVLQPRRPDHAPEEMVETFVTALRKNVPLDRWADILSYSDASEPVRHEVYRVAMALAKQASRWRRSKKPEPPAFGSWKELRNAATERLRREAA